MQNITTIISAVKMQAYAAHPKGINFAINFRIRSTAFSASTYPIRHAVVLITYSYNNTVIRTEDPRLTLTIVHRPTSFFCRLNCPITVIL